MLLKPHRKEKNDLRSTVESWRLDGRTQKRVRKFSRPDRYNQHSRDWKYKNCVLRPWHGECSKVRNIYATMRMLKYPL
jgi:hypothetical protein